MKSYFIAAVAAGALAGGILFAPLQSANPNVIDVFGRTGHIKAAAGDYNTSLVPEGVNQYFTLARARASIGVLSPLVYNAGVISCPTCGSGSTTSGVTSWNGRSGDVLPRLGDYNTALVPEGATNAYFTIARARGSLSAMLPITYDPNSGVISCSTCGTGGGQTLSISVLAPLVYNATTGVISCPSCVVLDSSGNVSIPGSLTTGAASTTLGSIAIPGIPDGFICASGGKLVSQAVPCK